MREVIAGLVPATAFTSVGWGEVARKGRGQPVPNSHGASTHGLGWNAVRR